MTNKETNKTREGKIKTLEEILLQKDVNIILDQIYLKPSEKDIDQYSYRVLKIY